MCRLHQKIEQMWWSVDQPPLLLRAASHVYDMINRHNLNSRKNRSTFPSLPMISVGNITAGGSGKTPFVIWLAALLKNEGFEPVILCRGDGGNSAKPELLTDNSAPQTVGDEAVLMHQKSGCPVISGQDRVRASQMAKEHGDIAILDDGFQYLQLERICDIVLIPAEGVGNGHLIPAGPLREPLQALDRADLIVRTGEADSIEALTSGREWRWWTSGNRLTQLSGKKTTAPKQAIALTAIARPQRFTQSLETQGIEIKECYIFPDHHPFSHPDIEAALKASLPTIVTAKDAVKLKKIWPAGQELWVLGQKAEAEPELFGAILNQLKQNNYHK